MEVFQATAKAYQWLALEWSLQLLHLLSRELKVAVVTLPATARANFSDVLQVILEQLGLEPEDHHCCHFRRDRTVPKE